MKPEIEAVFLEIDKDLLRKRLNSLGARLIAKERKMKRVVFDQGPHAFARVRDEGDKIVATYKRFDDKTITGAKEVNVIVDDYERAIIFLKECGLKAKKYEESLRESWKLKDAEIDIDTWPFLPSYVEVEGLTVEDTIKVCDELGFKMDDAIYGSVDDIYAMYYDVTAKDVTTWPEIVFEKRPVGLIGKRIRRLK